MHSSNCDPTWIKFGKFHDFVFLGKDVMATASGIYVSFFDLTTKKERIEKFNDAERGDGASCLAGHPVVPMFSIVERKSKPKISIFAYPSIRKISSCVNEISFNDYLSTSFIGTDYFVALTNYPNFQLIVWLWRNGEKMTTIDTNLYDSNQSISCSLNSPFYISQRAHESGKLSIYQLHVCAKIITLIPVQVKLPCDQIVAVAWTQSGGVVICDKYCNVWKVSIVENKSFVIAKSGIQRNTRYCPLITIRQNDVIVADVKKNITFYRKSNWTKTWQSTWTTSVKSQPLTIACNNSREGIFFHAENGEIFEIRWTPDEILPTQSIRKDDIKYKIISNLSPYEDLFIAIDKFDYLRVLHALTGQFMSGITLTHHGESSIYFLTEFQILCVDHHPVSPIFVVSSNTGNCLFIAMFNKPEVKIVNCFHLCKKSLDRVKYSQNGLVVGVCSSNHGQIFIISGNPKCETIRVVGLLDIDNRITDYLILNYEVDKVILFVFVATNEYLNISDKLVIYECRLNNEFEWHIKNNLYLPNSYQKFCYSPTNNIYCVPSLSKQLHLIKISDDLEKLFLVQSITTRHQLRNIEINTTLDFVITSGYDGLVVMREHKNIDKIFTACISHHRTCRGIKYSVLIGEMIISLGRNGDLIGMKMQKKIEKLNLPPTGEEVSSLKVFDRDEQEQDDTWVDKMDAIKLKNIADQSMHFKKLIIEDFQELKKQITYLLNLNAHESDTARMAISTFDIDHNGRQQKLQTAKVEREILDESLKNTIMSQDRIALHLREKFWKPLIEPSRALFSLTDELKVQNFVIISNDESELLDIDKESEKVELPVTFQSDVSKKECWKQTEKILQEAMLDKDEKLCLSGTTYFKWIKDETLDKIHQILRVLHQQNDIVTLQRTITNRELELKIHFNKLFEETRSRKEREIADATRRVEKLQHCVYELKTFFDVDCDIEQMEAPSWRTDEALTDFSNDRTRSITDDGCSQVASSQARDDFYTSALNAMMDGTLRVRWEDEIKKDIPKPVCLLTKKIDDFNEEDLKAVELYESRIEVLQNERQKYKTMLIGDVEDTKEQLKKNIEKFDEELKSFHLTRIRLESSVLQEKLLRHRTTKRYRWENDRIEEIDILTNVEVPKLNVECRELTVRISSFESALSESKSRYENATKREKTLEAKFRMELEDLKPPMMEHMLRHYKRRPRVNQLVCTSNVYLVEMGKCAIARTRSDILPRDCHDYLRGLDDLDAMPSGLPSQITHEHWRTMCRLRRVKIEMEFKIKSCAIEVAEAEQTLLFYQRLSQAASNKLTICRDNIEELRKSSTRLSDNTEIQLVLRTGQVEIPLHGETHDCNDSVFVSCDRVIKLNENILKVGTAKLNSIDKSANFRKIIEFQEWHHCCQRIICKNMENELNNLRNIKITKEIQEYLHKYPNVTPHAVEEENVNRNIKAMQKKFDETLKDAKSRLDETTNEVEYWRKRNSELSSAIERKQTENFKLDVTRRDPGRSRIYESRCKLERAIARRTRLVTRIQDNYEELISLHARLDLMKLRTYPTLKFRAARERK